MRKTRRHCASPGEVVLWGAVAGLAGTLVISGLSRMVYPAAGPEKQQPGEADPEHPQAVTPAGVLAQAQAPGPEGAASLFALKVGSGLFGRDLSKSARMAGQAVHYVYGTLWGVLYGLAFGSLARRRALSGTSHGLFVWGIGPGFLVPAMKLALKPADATRRDNLFSITGHMIYGFTLGNVFKALQRRNAHA